MSPAAPRSPSPDGILACSPRHDHATRRTLEIDVGPDQVREALELATSADPPSEPPSPMRQLLERLGDPTFADWSITKLMREVGVSLPVMLDAIRKRDVQVAIVNSSKRLAPVLDGVGEQAEPRWAICPRCGGEGEVVDERSIDPDDPDADPVMVKCFAAYGGCDGSGKVKLAGDLDAVKVFLGVHGLGGSGRGGGGAGNVTNVTVPVTQISANSSGDARDAKRAIDVTATVQRILENGS